MSEKIRRFLAENQPPTPCLVVDLDLVEAAYDRFRACFPGATVFYALKANPMREIVSRLAGLGASFDVASLPEISLCLELGVPPGRLSYGNTIKKARDIAGAYRLGVRLFALDSRCELEKLAAHAPGSRVFCRLATSGEGARWPLSGKFGCTPAEAGQLLREAAAAGLVPEGISFHAGSQQENADGWRGAIATAARLFATLRDDGINLRTLNAGGGFPIRYCSEIPAPEVYSGHIYTALRDCFGNMQPEVALEPGRAISGAAGIIQSEVVLVADRGDGGRQRWVYLDVGRFSGLMETTGEAIRYEIRTGRDTDPGIPVVIAGPSCDSADIICQQGSCRLPESLRVGDKVEILAAGAYTWSYSSVFFSGFGPLRAYCVP